jgi:hypothetical protein
MFWGVRTLQQLLVLIQLWFLLLDPQLGLWLWLLQQDCKRLAVLLHTDCALVWSSLANLVARLLLRCSCLSSTTVDSETACIILPAAPAVSVAAAPAAGCLNH